MSDELMLREFSTISQSQYTIVAGHVNIQWVPMQYQSCMWWRMERLANSKDDRGFKDVVFWKTQLEILMLHLRFTYNALMYFPPPTLHKNRMKSRCILVTGSHNVRPYIDLDWDQHACPVPIRTQYIRSHFKVEPSWNRLADLTCGRLITKAEELNEFNK